MIPSTSLAQANQAFRSGKFAEALRLYHAVLQQHPTLAKSIEFNLILSRRRLHANGGESAVEEELVQLLQPATSQADVSFIQNIVKNLNACDLVTFDIWDTVLRRDCDPDEIKLRAARVFWLLSIKSGKDADQTTPIKLFWLRKEAEHNVADENYEYQVENVIQEWLRLYGIDEPMLSRELAKKIIASELLAECSVTRPDATILDLLKIINSKRVLAISDFYHSSNNLVTILRHHDLENHFARIYVSCDWMKTKRAGSLYDLVFSEEKTRPSRILHIGDNSHADYQMANEKGMHAYLYQNPVEKKRIDSIKQTFEEYLAGNPARHYINILNELDCRQHVSPTGNIESITDLSVVGKLLSPIIVGFVLSCMQEAIRRQCDRIFFFAREGIFFKRIYEELVSLDIFDLGQYPQPKILYVSRRATFAASLRELSLNEMMRMWNMYSTQSVKAMARSLNLDTEEVASIAHKYGIDPDVQIQYPWLNDKYKAFFNSSEFQNYALPILDQQKTRLLQHLETAGFEPEANIDRVIVDIGWRGTIQDNISFLVNGNIHGVYIALKQFLNWQPDNSTKCGYLADDNSGRHFDLDDVAALEFILNAPGGSVIGYEKNGGPQREIFPGEENIINKQVAAIQSGIVDGTQRLGQYIRRHGLIAEDLIPLARHLVSCYLNTPPNCVADAFLALEHNETFGTGEAEQIGLVTTTQDIAQLSGAALHSALEKLRSDQRWSASLFNTTHFKKLFAHFRSDQTLNIPCSGVRKSVFSIIRPETRRDIIALVTPSPLAGSGGHRTIYNFAKGLARDGFNVHLMLESVNDDLWYVEQELAGHPITLHKKWFAGIRPQVAVATIAHSAKYVRECFPESIGAYFVQDYEAEFNPLSDGYVRGQNSYAQGLAPICIGHWLPHVLRKQFGIGAAYGGLGVDTSIYYPISGVAKKDMVAFLYQPEKWRRMPETCIAALAIVKHRRPQTEIVLYGSNAQPNLPFEANQRGLIHDLSELNRIYNEASVGLCLSLTNPSRIPIEYMAAGCVPVDLYRYNNFFDNPTGTSLLAYQSEASIAEAILHLLENPDECNSRREKGIALAKQRTLKWEVDTSVNAIRWLLSGASIDEIQQPECIYHHEPIIAPIDRTREVFNFCSWQHNLSL